eukprot:TRINITY_DN15284_c0_g1_i1.p1 TRINITY_DN15284_c0_g1~~TRINITY_DN15284_c0_g1_i1.p1  ORF type:complete len:239 (+),score=57.83 TRINITY_DN15284_c0_g1_i1:93-809(+)
MTSVLAVQRQCFHAFTSASAATSGNCSKIFMSTATSSAATSLMQYPYPLVLCGPSGSGKSTVLKKLIGEYEDCFGFSVSHTTRNPRPGEQDGKDYHFVTRDTMKDLIAKGAFIEHAEFSGNMYGTSKDAVQHVLKSGKICILDIDVQGVKSVKNTDLKPKYVFIKPPSLEVLEERLRGRGTETEESLNKRLSAAASELEYGETEGNFDIIIVNDEVDKAYAALKQFVIQDLDKIRKIP